MQIWKQTKDFLVISNTMRNDKTLLREYKINTIHSILQNYC